MRPLAAFLIAFAAGLLLGTPARAQQITVDIDEDLAEELGLDPDTLSSAMTDTIGADLNLADASGFLESMADAAVISSKGMGVDYASNPNRFVAGVSIGSGVDSGGARFGKGGRELPEYGFSFQVSAMAGVNLGLLSKKDPGEGFLSRFLLYANGMALNTSGEYFDGSLENVGAHMQVRLFKPRSLAVVKWGGIALTGGYELSNYHLLLTKDLPLTTSADGADLTWKAQGTYTVDAASTSIPVELSTNFRVLFITAFAGGGVDLTDGAADSQIKLAGDIDGSVGNQTATLGKVNVRWNGHGMATEMVPRFFGGVQFNALMAKVYGQVNVGLNNSFGGHAGVRVAF